MANAQYQLGLCYAEGVGVDRRDEREAARWLARASAQGHMDARYWLAQLYYYSDAWSCDECKEREAVRMFGECADSGLREAQWWVQRHRGRYRGVRGGGVWGVERGVGVLVEGLKEAGGWLVRSVTARVSTTMKGTKTESSSGEGECRTF